MKFKIKKKKFKFKAKNKKAPEYKYDFVPKLLDRYGNVKVTSPLSLFNVFADRCRMAKTNSSMVKFIKAEYEFLNKGHEPLTEVTLDEMHVAVGYHLLVAGYMALEKELPEKVLMNYKAAYSVMFGKRGEYNFTPSLKGLLDITLYVDERAQNKLLKKENEMSEKKTKKKVVKKVAKTVKKAAKKVVAKKAGVSEETVEKVAKKGKKVVKKAAKKVVTKKPAAKKAPKGPKVYESYIELFKKNARAKLTDKELAKEMCKRHPDKKTYTEKDIATCRKLYNAGKLTSMEAAPKQQAKQY